MSTSDLTDALGRAERDLDDADRRWFDTIRVGVPGEAEAKASQDAEDALAEVHRLEAMLAELPASEEPW